MFKSIYDSLKTVGVPFHLGRFIFSFILLITILSLINAFVVPNILDIPQQRERYSISLSFITLFISFLGAYISSTRNIFDNYKRFPPAGGYFMVLFFIHVNLLAVFNNF